MILFTFSEHGSNVWHFVPFVFAAALLLHGRTRRKVKSLVLLLVTLVKRWLLAFVKFSQRKLRYRVLRSKAKKESDLNANIDHVENVRLVLPRTHDEKPQVKVSTPRVAAKKVLGCILNLYK